MNEPIDARAAALLEQRAERLRQKKDDGAEEEGVWAAEFELGGQRWALPLERLSACMPLKGVTPVPLARRGVLGVTRWEGRVVAVFSLSSLLGLRGWRQDPAVLLLISRGEHHVGLDCEEIPRSLQLPQDCLAGGDGQGVSRVLSVPVPGRSEPRLLHWIDPDRLLQGGA